MSYEVNYSGLSEPEKSEKAVQDIKNYLGDEYSRVEGILQTITDKKSFLFGCEFVGIVGYLAEALYTHLHNN